MKKIVIVGHSRSSMLDAALAACQSGFIYHEGVIEKEDQKIFIDFKVLNTDISFKAKKLNFAGRKNKRRNF